MKSIRATLEIIRDITNALPGKVTIALVGGFAVIAHGVERTTIDLDFCLYSDILDTSGTKYFFELLKKNIPKRFELQLMEGSKIPVGHRLSIRRGCYGRKSSKEKAGQVS